MLSAADVLSRLVCDPVQGCFYWRPKIGTDRWTNSWNARCAGRRAGSVNKKGYVSIEIDSVGYLAHRLMWLCVHGTWPTSDIDHRDGRRDNNAITNLRVATESQNGGNARRSRRSTTGVKGVTFSRRALKYHARISVDGTTHHLGFFEQKQDAALAYAAASVRFFGEFGRTA